MTPLAADFAAIRARLEELERELSAARNLQAQRAAALEELERDRIRIAYMLSGGSG